MLKKLSLIVAFATILFGASSELSAGANARAQFASGVVTSVFDRRLERDRVSRSQWDRFVRELKLGHQQGKKQQVGRPSRFPNGVFEFSRMRGISQYTWKAQYAPRRTTHIGTAIIRRPEGVWLGMSSGRDPRVSTLEYSPHDHVSQGAFISARGRGAGAGGYTYRSPGWFVDVNFFTGGRVSDLTNSLTAYRYVARLANQFLRRVAR